jgi:hypothetical protein
MANGSVFLSRWGFALPAILLAGLASLVLEWQ